MSPSQQKEDITMSTPRFNFAGFTLLRTADNATHEVEVGKVTMGEQSFVVHMIRRAGLAFEGNFLLAKICDSTENELWNFSVTQFNGVGLLARVGDELVISLVGRGREGKVEDVIPFSSIFEHQPVGILRKFELKKGAADFLGREYQISVAENKLHKIALEQKLAAEVAAREAAAEARREAREQLKRTIFARGQIQVYTSTGQKRFGYPVLETEWSSLDKGTSVVLVESVGANGPVGKVVEAFQIKKERGKNPEKDFLTPVTLERPIAVSATTTSMPRPIDSIIIVREGEPFEVALYSTMDDIRQARSAGLNSGSYAAARDHKGNGKDGRIEVFSIRKDGITTLGLFAAL
jgi:hypothetical protein